MTDLLDIVPATAVETVMLSDGAEVTVHRLHFDQIAALAARFPKLIALLALGENACRNLSAAAAHYWRRSSRPAADTSATKRPNGSPPPCCRTIR